MSLTDRNSIYFIGIGGIGMSAIAQYFLSQGKEVFGYDRQESSLTIDLVAKGAQIHYQDRVEEIDESFLDIPKENSWVIYTPAIPTESLILNYFLKNGFETCKRSKALALIVRDKYSIAIAGTHGKTTTSSIISHLLMEGKGGCNAFLGGIATNYNSNVLIDNDSELTVIEADEFDRSFLQLNPDMAVITSTDADHLDIYEGADCFQNAFNEFAGQVKQEGVIFFNDKIDFQSYNLSTQSYTYGFSEQADYRITDLKIIKGTYHFAIQVPGKILESLSFHLPGRYNVENAAAAIAVAHHLDIPEDKIRRALSSFAGVKRRFEYHINQTDLVYIDDYAHHPSELNACISAVRDFYPKHKITGIFQPHLYSRTRDFLDGFARSLSQLDEIVLLEIYPAREKPIPGINSGALLEKIETDKKSILTKAEIIDQLDVDNLEVLLTLGAGDIDELVEPISEVLRKQLNARVA